LPRISAVRRNRAWRPRTGAEFSFSWRRGRSSCTVSG